VLVARTLHAFSIAGMSSTTHCVLSVMS
jgi:hypothetical protein